ncbi:cilia- and flagella-associated protein 221-like [Ciona intestinalis]
MAAIKSHRMTGLKSSKKGTMLDEFISPVKRINVPNHILDTKIFNKLSQNSVTKVQPDVVHFSGYKLHKTHKTSIKICNASPQRQNLHIIPPATKYFSIQYTKPDRLVPGFTIEVIINFTADEWRYYYDCIRIHCKGEENLIVPLHAFPVMDTSRFPRKLVFPQSGIRLGESCRKILPLRSHSPVEFEFQISVLQSHPSIVVNPLSGIVPGEGGTDISVTFTPMEYVTAHMTMQLVISQFNTKPLLCDVTASCSPSATVQLTRSVRDLDEVYKQTKLLDPRCISPIQIARRRQRHKNVPLIRSFPNKDFEYDGLQFPANVNSQHAVNSVLMQHKGKLRVKDLRMKQESNSVTAVASKSTDSLTSVSSTRQMKEAAFEKITRQDAIDERANQLRWQVHLGEDPISEEARVDVVEQRELASEDYKYMKMMNPRKNQELVRSKSKKIFRRTLRGANKEPEASPQFDLYKNKSWTVRHRALARFQQAARTILIQCRADKKVVMLRKLVEDFGKGLIPSELPLATSSKELTTGISPFQIEAHDHGATAGTDTSRELLINFTPDQVKPFTFPMYVSPDTKEDIAPDALGEVPIDQTEVAAKRNIPFHDLVVPRYYELAGYKRHNVDDALNNYVPPGLARQLRTGAEDEIIQVILPSKQNSEGNDSKMTDEDTSEMLLTEEPESTSGLIPPAGLFKNPSYHKLHIFNRVPGLSRHYIPLQQTEVDQSYHLCPIPRYNRLPAAKKFMDREDVIKGIMSWKKFSSHGLAALSTTPTLSDVWLPRWSDSFSQAMLPSEAPQLLNQLPHDDQMFLTEEEGEINVITPEMIAAQFAMEEQLRSEVDEDENKVDEFPNSSKLPTNNIGISTLGPTSREGRQRDLEVFIQNKFDKLGERMLEQVTKIGLDEL